MPTHDDDTARRAFWTAMLDEADAFMAEVRDYPVQECGEPMASLAAAAADAGVEVAFSELPHVEGLPRLFFLRVGLIPQFLTAARELNERGWVLQVEDAYRTTRMQRGLGLRRDIFSAILHKVQWETGATQPPVELLLRRCGALIANAPKVGTHMSGSAMDISVLDRDSGELVDRGGFYPEMSERTPMSSPFVSPQAQQHRQDITALMTRHGFVTYPWEFWHYNDGDAYAEILRRTGKPVRYGAVDVDLSTGAVTPIADPTAPLVTPEVVRETMERLLAEQ